MLKDSEKVILFSPDGHPLLFNLDFLNFPIPKLKENEEYIAIITNSPSATDNAVLDQEISKIYPSKPLQIQINKWVLNVEIDFDTNTVFQLMFMIYGITGIMPNLQRLYYRPKEDDNSSYPYIPFFGEAIKINDLEKSISSF